MELLEIDEIQANAILDMQLRRLAALERQKIIDRLAELETIIADLEDILASEERQRQIVSEELTEIVDKFGDERRSQIIAADGDLSMEDLIPDEDLVVTITRGGYAKRTNADLYRTQKRGGKGVRGATLRGDDVVEHFMATSNHHWLLFFTTAGRVYRTKAYNLPEASRDAKGGHVAGLLSFQPDESIAQVLAIRDYEQAPYLVLATRNGLVKKTRLGDYNSPRQAGVIAINFREDDDELIGAELVDADDDILLVSRKGQAIRFRADDAQLRPMGRATSGVTGMKFRGGDQLLSMSVIRAEQVAAEEAADARSPAGESARTRELPGVVEQYVFTITDGGFAKRTRISEYRLQSRGGIGIKAMKQDDDRGNLVGAFIVVEGDEVLAIKQSGQVTRSAIDEHLRPTGRDTKGVRFVGVTRVTASPWSPAASSGRRRSTRRSRRPSRPRRRRSVLRHAVTDRLRCDDRAHADATDRAIDATGSQSTTTCGASDDDGDRGVLMADRRADDTPLAPRRSLSGPSHAADAQRRPGKRPLTERVLGGRRGGRQRGPVRGDAGRGRTRPRSAARPTVGRGREPHVDEPGRGARRSSGAAERAVGRHGPRAGASARHPPGPAAAGPDRPLVGDEDVVPALDRVRHRDSSWPSPWSGRCSAPPASGTRSTRPSATCSAGDPRRPSTSRTTSAPAGCSASR